MNRRGQDALRYGTDPEPPSVHVLRGRRQPGQDTGKPTGAREMVLCGVDGAIDFVRFPYTGNHCPSGLDPGHSDAATMTARADVLELPERCGAQSSRSGCVRAAPLRVSGRCPHAVRGRAMPPRRSEANPRVQCVATFGSSQGPAATRRLRAAGSCSRARPAHRRRQEPRSRGPRASRACGAGHEAECSSAHPLATPPHSCRPQT